MQYTWQLALVLVPHKTLDLMLYLLHTQIIQNWSRLGLLSIYFYVFEAVIHIDCLFLLLGRREGPIDYSWSLVKSTRYTYSTH